MTEHERSADHPLNRVSLQMNSDVKARCFRDIRDVVFGLTHEEWRATSRKLSHKFSRLELVVLCSALVKILCSVVLQCVLPGLIDAVGMERVLSAETRLWGGGPGSGSSPGSAEDPSVCVSSFMRGVLTQIKEAMKQALQKFCSVKTVPESRQMTATVGEPSRDCSLIDALTTSSTNTIIAEIVPLFRPDISHQPEQQVSFQHVINSIMKALRHVHQVQRSSSVTDDEWSTSSEGYEGNLFSKRSRIKAMHAVSGILLDAAEELSSARSRRSDTGPLDEIEVTSPSVRVRPTAVKITKSLLKGLKNQPSSNQTNSTELTFSRSTLLPAACKIYKDVQKNVFAFLLKVQALTTPEEESCVESAEHQLQKHWLENDEDPSTSEGGDVFLRKAAEVSSSTAQDEEQLHLEACTDEVIRNILSVYRTQARYLAPDLVRSLCARLVSDVLVKNVQSRHVGEEKHRNMWRSRSSDMPLRKLSRATKPYLDSAAVEMTQLFLKDLEECVKSRNQTRTEIVRVSNTSAFVYSNIFTPFRLFRQVRNKVADIFCTLNKAGRRGVIGGTLSSGGFSQGFARRQVETENSSVNQLKRLLSSDSDTKCHERVIADAITTILGNVAGIENFTKRFSELVLKEERWCCDVFRVCGISVLVHSFIPELVTRLARYFSNTGFLLTEFHKAETTSGDENAIMAALRELTRTLKDFIEESTDTSARSVTSMRRTRRKTKTRLDLKTRNRESQLSTLDDEDSSPSAQGSSGEKKKKKRKRRRITIQSTALKKLQKNKTSKNLISPAEHQEGKGNNVSFRETAAGALRRRVAAFFSPLRSLFISRRVRRCHWRSSSTSTS